ncbi:645_t:CDS:2 [Funneliformis geosporum]|uniref:645_t:CDS:1 n=1 Tax=Funneliformis geosporum TaxID=1117311 RepID=A0A9W4SQI3_9GLOM|nr:645_t:CDS:2 [Funneliformis geosporum]
MPNKVPFDHLHLNGEKEIQCESTIPFNLSPVTETSDKIKSSTKTISSESDQQKTISRLNIIALLNKQHLIIKSSEAFLQPSYNTKFNSFVSEYNTGVTNKTARIQIYKEMVEHLTGDMLVAL